MASDLLPIADSYWVFPGRLRAGEYPSSQEEHEARAKARWLLSLGVSYCLDLTEAGEYGLRQYAPLLREEAAALGQGIVHQRVPIPDYGTPSKAEMVAILETLDGALQAGHMVYVHCYGGIGRTGTVIGCYLARHGMGGADSLEHIARLRAGTPDSWRQSPETEDQRQLVLNWGREE